MRSLDGSYGRIVYEIAGPAAGPTLVFCNALGTSAAMWEPQFEALSDRLRLVRFDYPGHGRSETAPGPYAVAGLAQDVLRILEETGATSASICGLSLGGMLGLWLAGNEPDAVDALIVCSSAPELGPAQRWLDRAATAREGGTEQFVARALDRWFAPGYLESRPEVGELAADMLRTTTPEGYAGACEALASADLRSGLDRISTPTLVVSGRDDPAIAPETSQAMAAAIPGARASVVDVASHLVNLERPELFNRLVEQHVALAATR